MSVQPTLPGIHHITAIASDPQPNVDFYMGLLGLRLVKKTVNFDDPGSYHLYYGDDLGRPGTIMTFFAWPGSPKGRVGAGQVGVTSFSVPNGSLDYWRDRLSAAGVTVEEGGERWGDEVLSFVDPDDMPLEIIAASPGDDRSFWLDGPVPERYAIRGFHAPTLYVNAVAPSERVLTSPMGFRRVAEEGGRLRLAAGEGKPGDVVDLVAKPDLAAWQAAGTVHHIAWRTPTDEQQVVWQDVLSRAGLHVTEVRDRNYFHSIYYREPGRILYEIATDEPGFAVDEPVETLGHDLKLPPWLESQREQIERALPPITLPQVERAEAVR